MKKEIADIRKDYRLQELTEADVATDAIEQFTRWWQEAVSSQLDEVNAMTLATATKSGLPHARIVLLKDYNEKGFVFYTNYSSHKGHEMHENPHAALLFFWPALERQVRIEGVIEKVTAAESDEYFQSRPVGSRIGAWASPQSTVIADREILEENVQKYSAEFTAGIPRPPHWGGYRLVPNSIEFWQGRSSRLHDRILFTKTEGGWQINRLAP